MQGGWSTLPAVKGWTEWTASRLIVKGNKVENRSTGMGKYGEPPEPVNDVSTIHSKLSLNYLEGRHDHFCGVFELEE